MKVFLNLYTNLLATQHISKDNNRITKPIANNAIEFFDSNLTAFNSYIYSKNRDNWFNNATSALPTETVYSPSK